MTDVETPESSGGSLEQRLLAVNHTLPEALKVLSRLKRHLAALDKAAELGDLRSLRVHIEGVAAESRVLGACADTLFGAYGLADDAAEAALLTGDYGDELIKAAADEGIRITRADDRFIAYPSSFKLLPEERVIELNHRRVSTLRPSVLIALLANARKVKSSFKPQRFADLLFAAHGHLHADPYDPGKSPLDAIYRLLTLLPQAASSYEREEFFIDVHRLASSSPAPTTSKGVGVRFPPGATGLKAGGEMIYSDTGEVFTYFQVVFLPPER